MDNPDAKKLIPVPLIGFKALQQRIQCQDQQAKIYQGRLDAIAEEISDLQKRHEDTLAKMRDAKRRHLALSHRVLHVMVKQEVTRKTGFTIQVRVREAYVRNIWDNCFLFFIARGGKAGSTA
jgi:nuclear pore complex protein Nup54